MFISILGFLFWIGVLCIGAIVGFFFLIWLACFFDDLDTFIDDVKANLTGKN